MFEACEQRFAAVRRSVTWLSEFAQASRWLHSRFSMTTLRSPQPLCNGFALHPCRPETALGRPCQYSEPSRRWNVRPSITLGAAAFSTSVTWLHMLSDPGSARPVVEQSSPAKESASVVQVVEKASTPFFTADLVGILALTGSCDHIDLDLTGLSHRASGLNELLGSTFCHQRLRQSRG